MAANTDKFKKGARRFTTTVGTGGIPDASATTVPLTVVTGLPIDTAIEITVDRVNPSGELTLANEEVITGVVSGNDLIDCIRGVEGTAQAHSAGATVEVRLTANQWNDSIDGFLLEHNQDGTHKGFGWETYTGTMPTIESSANGVDTLRFGNVDLVNTLEKDMWIRLDSGAGNFQIFKIKSSVPDGADTLVETVGEVSPTGTITKVSYSRMAVPTGVKPWESLFYSYAARNTSMAIPDSTISHVYFNDIITNPSNSFVSSTFTAKVTGIYEIGASVGFLTNAVGYRRVLVYKNGASFLEGATEHSPGFCTPVMNPAIVTLNRGDTINIHTYQSSGGDLNTRANSEVSVTVKFISI
jgi:hypothetical protein